MSLTLTKYSSDYEQVWDDFLIEKSINSTFLHSRKFYKHNELNDKDDCSFLLYDGNKLIALFPANLYEKNEIKILHSYLRSTYGGLVICDETTTLDLIDILTLLEDEAKLLGVDEIIIRPTFSIYNSGLVGSIDYALWKKGYGIKYREVEFAIELDKHPMYASSCKRSTAAAYKKGIVVKESDDIETYWGILSSNLKERYGVAPVHSISQIRQLQRLTGSQVKLFAAYLEGIMIGGILIFIANRYVVHAQYIASDSRYQEYRPLNATIDSISIWAKNAGYKYFNLGMATEPGGIIVNDGLMRFKEGFGARGVLRETMNKIL